MKLLTQFSLLLLACCYISTGVYAADAPMVREVFACNFKKGKDMDDLMAARDFFVRQTAKMDVGEQEHFVWTPYKVNTPYDFLWFSNSPDLVSFGKDSDTFNNSPEGQAAQARFDQVADCTSAIAMRRQIFATEGGFSGGPPAIINSSACKIRKGVDETDLEDLWNHINGVLTGLKLKNGLLGFVSVPMVASPNSPDLYLYGVQGSMEDWATTQVALASSPAGPNLRRHFNLKLDCSASLWFGQRVVPLPE